MEKRIALDQYHKMGSHCLTSALRDIFDYNGLQLSEDMCLGLGSGYGFIYVRQADVCIFGGRGGNLESNICNVLGIKMKALQTEDGDYAMEAVKKSVNQGVPVLLDVDMTHLPYLAERFQITSDFRFGGHKLIFAGYDDKKQQAFLYDYLWKNVQVVNTNDLKKARGSQIKPVSPDNTWMTFAFPSRIIPLHIAVKNAISYNVQQMMYPVGIGIGHKALVRFAREIKIWPKVMKPERLKREMFIANMTFEKIGTGGGNFRRMYSRFLREAADLLSMPELKVACEIFAALGNLWKEFSAKLYAASEDLENSEAYFFQNQEVSLLLEDLVALEGKGLQKLDEIFGR